jgi:hypothetical protein
VAAVIGLLLGLGLLSLLRPSVPEAETQLVAPRVRTQLEVRRPAAPPAAVAPAQAEDSLGGVVGEAAAPDDDALEVLSEIELYVDVVDEDGRPTERAWVQPLDCPGFKGTGPGAFLVEPGTCTVRAVRRDGALFTRTEATPIAVSAPGPVYAQLTLSSKRTGGIGVRFMPHPDGVRVVSVAEGTPAWEAGLAAGDVIVEVAGHVVSELDSDQFVQLMTGPEGSEVEFVVGISTDTGLAEEAVVVERAFLDG